MAEEKDVTVKRFKCKCSNAVMLSVIDGEHEKLKSTQKEWLIMLKEGYDCDTISLEEARSCEFGCKCNKDEW